MSAYFQDADLPLGYNNASSTSSSLSQSSSSPPVISLKNQVGVGEEASADTGLIVLSWCLHILGLVRMVMTWCCSKKVDRVRQQLHSVFIGPITKLNRDPPMGHRLLLSKGPAPPPALHFRTDVGKQIGSSEASLQLSGRTLLVGLARGRRVWVLAFELRHHHQPHQGTEYMNCCR